MALIDKQRRLHEVGRIRIGDTVPTQNGKTRPTKLDTFRFTSQNQDAIEHLASIHGGTSEPWSDAPTGKQWQVTTDTDKLRVLVPPESMSFSQFYELWAAGGCLRRCDGERQTSDELCICDPEHRECSPHSRVSVMLADFPTSGLWRLDTQGENAAIELAGGFEFAKILQIATGRSLLSATLRLEQREKKRPGEQTRKFAVPVIDFDVDVTAFVGNRSGINAPVVTLELTPGVTPIQSRVDEEAALSVEEQLRINQSVVTPPAKRSNAATPLPATGLAPRTAAGASQPSMRRLFALLGGKGIRDDNERHKWATEVLGREVASFSDLNQQDVTKLNDAAEGKTELDEPF